MTSRAALLDRLAGARRFRDAIAARPWSQRALRSAGIVALAGVLLGGGIPFSASAVPWISALGGSRGGAFGVLGTGMRNLTRTATWLSPASTIGLWQWGVACAQLALLIALARRLRGPWTAVAAVTLAVLWPGSRASLVVCSAESLLATTTLAAALFGLQLDERPRRAAALLGLSLAGAALAHPMGLTMLPLIALILPIWPRPVAPSATGTSSTMLAVRCTSMAPT